MTNLFEIARLLSQSYAEFVIVGGVAIRSRDGNYVTEDLDIRYSGTRENLKKIANVLEPLKPRPRGMEKFFAICL